MIDYLHYFALILSGMDGMQSANYDDESNR